MKLRNIGRYIIIAYLLFGLNSAALAEEPQHSYPVNQNNGQPVEMQKPLKIYANQNEFSLRFLAFVDGKENAMIALTDCRLLFDLDMQIDEQKQVIISKADKKLVLKPDNYILFSSASIVSFPGIPASRLEIIYLPLSEVAKAWDVKMEYEPAMGNVKLIFPDKSDNAAGSVQNIISSQLPIWGDFSTVPAMASLWPGQEIIGGYYTTLINSSANRNSNIVLSCGKLNESVVKPGHIFSFNQVVGNRTTAAGYKPAPVFSGKKVVTGIGGGICQASSTLYNSALQAGLKIIERHPHSLPVKYVAANHDATVSYGNVDLKFRNSQSYAIKILARVYDKYVVMAIARAEPSGLGPSGY